MDAWSVGVLAFAQILLSGELKLTNVGYTDVIYFCNNPYLQVSNSYVMKKSVVILYPPSNKVWNRLQADEFEREGEVSPVLVELTTEDGVSKDVRF